MAGIGLAGGAGAGGAVQGLQDVLAQRLFEAKLAEQQRVNEALAQRQAEAAQLDREQFAFQQRESVADRETRAAERRAAAEERAKSEGIRQSEWDAAQQGREFEREMGRKDTAEAREARSKERGEDRAFQAGENAKNRAARGSDERLVQVMGPNGSPIWVRESQAVGQPAAQAARAVTGAERQSLAYFNRAKEALDTLTRSTTVGPSGLKQPSLEDKIARQGAVGQVQLQTGPNFLQTDDQQRYRQAQRAFTEARLRKESGAAIPRDEYNNDARTYFAQPGDSKATIEQKRKARETVLEGLKFSSGKAFDEFYGDSGPSSVQPGRVASGAERTDQPAKPKPKFNIVEVK